MKNPTAAQRKYAYRVANILLAIAVTYKVIDGTQSALFLLLINALLGLADKNVDAHPQ